MYYSDKQLQDGDVISCEYLIDEAVDETYEYDGEDQPLYWFFYNDRNVFENIVAEESISPLTAFFFEEEESQINEILESHLGLGSTEKALTHYIGSIYNSLVADFQGGKEPELFHQPQQKSPRKSKPASASTKTPLSIPFGSFVIKGNIFHCTHAGHNIQDVKAIISFLTDAGDIKNVIISAGYCEKCKLFFIMDSVLKQVRSYGRPLCTIVEYKVYRANPRKYENWLGGFKSESILKTFGYSVSLQEGLSDRKRHKILAEMIDRKILTRQEIINYLESFIRLRKNQYKYENAIEKWEQDIMFVSQYKVGSFMRDGIRAIELVERRIY